jgi:hypothetical protein
MNLEFRKGLERKRIESFPQAIELVEAELSAADDDLSEAIDRLKNKNISIQPLLLIIRCFMPFEHWFIQRAIAKKVIITC